MGSVLWLILCIALFILEACTATLVCIWFAIGAVAAFIASLFNLNTWLCISIFIVVSLVSLILTRKYAVKFIKAKKTATNADSLIGKPAIVTQEIDEVKASGEVMVKGQVWRATTRVGEVIKKGELVEVVSINGATLTVVSADNALSTISKTAAQKSE